MLQRYEKKLIYASFFANKNAIYADFYINGTKKENVNGSVAFVLLPHFHTFTLKKESKYKLENLKSNPELIDRCCGVLLTRAQ